MRPHHTGTVTGRVMRTAGTEIMASSMTEKEAGPPGTEIGTGTTAERITETSAALIHPPLEGAKLYTILTVQHHFSSGPALQSPMLAQGSSLASALHCLQQEGCLAKASIDIVLLVWHARAEWQLKLPMWHGRERGRSSGRGEWEETPRRRTAAEDEWEATPVRAGSARPASSARRPDTGASLDYLASPAGTPVRAGSAGGACATLLASRGSVIYLRAAQSTCMSLQLWRQAFIAWMIPCNSCVSHKPCINPVSGSKTAGRNRSSCQCLQTSP